MKADNVRTVHFMEVQDAEDLYRCHENGKVYVRQQCDKDHVRWLTSIKWKGGYEASGPLKAGITMRVVDSSEKVLFEEEVVVEEGYCDTVAVKKCGFSWEEIKKLGESVCKSVSLRSYNDWKSWLMRGAKEHQYTGYSENWMYWEVEREKARTMFRAEYLGKTVYVTIQKVTHKISGQTWEVVEIKDQSKLDTLHICGYLFKEDKK